MAANLARWVAVILAVSLGAGCAVRGSYVSSPGYGEKSTVSKVKETGSTPGVGESSGGVSPSAVRAVPARTTLQTAEQWDAGLAEALANLGTRPTTWSLFDVAEAYRRIGIGDRAADYYSQILKANPRDASAFDGLARVWRDWGFPQIALGEAYRAVYYAPTSPEAHNTLGTVLQALGSGHAAREHYVKAIALDSRAAYALNNLCGLELIEGKPVRAIAACEQALVIDSGLETARRNLAKAEAMFSR